MTRGSAPSADRTSRSSARTGRSRRRGVTSSTICSTSCFDFAIVDELARHKDAAPPAPTGISSLGHLRANERVNLKDESSQGQPTGWSPLTNPPRTASATCCGENELPCRFVGGIPSRQANPAKSRSFDAAIAPGSSQKPLDERNQATTPSRAEAQTRGDGPQFRRSGLDSRTAAASAPRPSQNPRPPQAGALSLSTRGSKEGLLTRSRCRMSILRSTSDGPIDERRCCASSPPKYWSSSTPRAPRSRPSCRPRGGRAFRLRFPQSSMRRSSPCESPPASSSRSMTA